MKAEVEDVEIVLIPLRGSFRCGIDESLTGVLSIVRSTSNCRFERSCRPVLALHRSGLARGGPPAPKKPELWATSEGSGKLDFRGSAFPMMVEEDVVEA